MCGVLMEREGIAFEDAIVSRVNVYRNTDFFDGEHHPAWGVKIWIGTPISKA